MKRYISDLHFFHEKVIPLDKRNFANVEEMNKYIINQWNSKVRGGDLIVVLGDMFWTKDVEKINDVLNHLNGKICLVEGNHDKMWLNREGVNRSKFEWIRPYAEFSDGDNFVIASHYPVFCYNHQFLKNKNGSDRTFMLYGHVHNTHDELLVNEFINITKKTVLKGSAGERKIPCNMINCFCGFSDYAPLSLKEWIKKDAARREQLVLPSDYVIPDEMN